MRSRVGVRVTVEQLAVKHDDNPLQTRRREEGVGVCWGSSRGHAHAVAAGGGEAAGGWACWRAALGGAMGYAGVSGGGSWDRRVHKERILSNSVEYFILSYISMY